MKNTILSRPGLGSQFCHWFALCLALLGIARGDVRVTECETVFTFGTGKQNEISLRPGVADPNFNGASRNFISGKALVVGTVPAEWLANAASTSSVWIGPASDGTSGAGTYVYRLTVVTPCVGNVRGRFAASDRGGLTINAVPTGIATPVNGAAQWTDIVFNGLPPGTNHLDFVVTNTPSILGGENSTGLRAEVTITATCCPCIDITCPADLVVTTCSNSIPVDYAPLAVNHCGPAPTVVCNPPSGSLFPVGTHSVVCSAADSFGHINRCVFKVTVVKEVTPPVIKCPPVPIRLLANADCRALVPDFSSLAHADCAAPGELSITQTPAAGTGLTVGVHVIKLKACRAGAAVSGAPICVECDLTVIVCSTPQIVCPMPITVNCSPDGAQVHFKPIATDPCGDTTSLVVSCQPPSGSVFPVGTTTVVCTAVNSCGISATCNFTVTVTGQSTLSTFPGGVDDNFAAPTEPASPGLCLLQAGLSVGKPFDDLTATRRWGHTLAGLPANITGARLIIGMQPLGPFAGLDKIHLGLSNCVPAKWAWTSGIAQLPGSGGTWTANGRVVFVLDLANLPGGANSLIGLLNQAHQLDVMTDGATRVDFCRLEVLHCGSSGHFAGIPFVLRDAIVRYTPLGIEFLPPDPSAPPAPPPPWHVDFELVDDRVLQFDFPRVECNSVGSHQGLVTDWKPNQDTVATLKFTPNATPARTDISMKQPDNSTGNPVEVYRNGQLVTRRYFSGPIPSGVTVPNSTCLFSMGFGAGYFFADFTASASITFLPGGEVVSGDDAATVVGDRIELGYVTTVKAPGSGPIIVQIGGLLPLLRVSDVRVLPAVEKPKACIAIECPPGLVIPCEQVSGAVVNFEVKVADFCGRRPTVVCTPPSGSVFPPGVTWVHCVATDGLGNRAQCRFPVQVKDTTPPVIQIPRRVIVPCTSPKGAVVDYAVGASDSCGPVILECIPPSGSVFPVGTTLVTCVATDVEGNRTTREFPVSVSGDCAGDSCLTLNVPEDIRVRCNTAGGALVNFTTSARNSCTGGNAAVTCVPPSGSLFPVGLTTVICTAKNGSVESKATFVVEVVDETPPVIHCPDPIMTKASNGRGAVVRFSVTATDDCTANPRVACRPPSGSVFPVGDTAVNCVADDGNGNKSTCSFIVRVLPPKPFVMEKAGPKGLRLRWSGDSQAQVSDLLDNQWLNLPGDDQPDGDERVLDVEPTVTARFFRILPRPLAPEPDADGDGVPDARDRCAETLPGTVVDAHGCSADQLLAEPELLTLDFDQAATRLRKALLKMPFSVPGASALLFPLPVAPSKGVVEALRRVDFAEAVRRQMVQLDNLRQLIGLWPEEKALRIRSLLAEAAVLDEANADIRPEDHDLADLDMFEMDLDDALRDGLALLDRLNNWKTRLKPLGKQRVQVQSVDLRHGLVVLADGRRVIFRVPRETNDDRTFGQGNQLDLDLVELGDGVLHAVDLVPVDAAKLPILTDYIPSCLRIRVVPVGGDFGERLHPRGYLWGFSPGTSRLYLESGMGLAAVKSKCLGLGGYRYWLRVRVDQDNDGIYGTSLASALDENSSDIVLPKGLPLYQVMGLEVAEFRGLVVNGVTQSPELVRTETYQFEIDPPGTWAEVDYDRTIFELVDKPDNFEYRKARVTDLTPHFPLTLMAPGTLQFSALAFGPSGEKSTYPDPVTVLLNQDFAVQWQDPTSFAFGTIPTESGTGLADVTVTGLRNGHTFVYRCQAPKVVHDRIHACNGVDSYYRIPFIGPLGFNINGGFSISQGNNGTFTHNGNQKYAFDFPQPAGTTILAARGGTVLGVRSTSCFSCWNPNAPDGKGGKGACVNCTGTSSPNTVTILHDDGTQGRYFHFSKNQVAVSVGQRIYRGDFLGGVGTTGCSTGTHLHFDVTQDPTTTLTIPIRFEAFDGDVNYHDCYLPPSQSNGYSTNKPWWWPF